MTHKSQSMVAPLLRVLVCPPHTAGWDIPSKAQLWQKLGFMHAPNYAVAQTQHDELCR